MEIRKEKILNEFVLRLFMKLFFNYLKKRNKFEKFEKQKKIFKQN